MSTEKAATLCRMAREAFEGNTSSWPPSPGFVLEAIGELIDFKTSEISHSEVEALAVAIKPKDNK